MWWVVCIAIAAVLVRQGWKTYTHPATVLVRQAANMDWLAIGTVKDSQGYRNTRLGRGGMEAEVSFNPPGVRLIKPSRETMFKDFLEVERWIGAGQLAEAEKALCSPAGNRYQQEVEGHVSERGYEQDLDKVRQSDRQYADTLLKAWLAAEQAKEETLTVAALTLTSLEYYGKNRDVSLSYLKRLENGWNAMVAHPGMARQIKQDAEEQEALESKVESYQEALASAQQRAAEFVSTSRLCEKAHEPVEQSKLCAWMLVYLSTYKAWKESGTEIHQGFWNTFQRRVELEMLEIRKDGRADGGVERQADGSYALVHFSSTYWEQMDELAGILESQGTAGLAERLNRELTASVNMLEFDGFMKRMADLAKRGLLTLIANMA